ncbi:coiled-coil domain-containing protein 124-B [Planococcus citri]|uniref:coiled-coil domain-containing protein 124-B n=1 Tax=Planococcus citri TaxID=170843 RepID=UPI0031F82192
MPKKFVGENSKAVVARARKEAVRKEEQQKKKQQEEDEYWRDDDKQIVKKQQRKDEKEKKKQELMEKKQAVKALLESEMSSIKSAKPEPKLTRLQITAKLTTEKKEAPSDPKVVVDEPIIENLNRLQIDGEEARTVDEALRVLGAAEKEIDKHPEKRMKAAFTAFEAENMERLKKEYPTLRLSQLKQMLRKEWMKSPANPLNNL